MSKKPENTIWKHMLVGLLIGALFTVALGKFPTFMILGIVAGLSYDLINKAKTPKE